MKKKYFVDVDFDCTWYLIPVDQREHWQKWERWNEEAEKNKDRAMLSVPEYAIKLGENIANLEFNWPDIRLKNGKVKKFGNPPK